MDNSRHDLWINSPAPSSAGSEVESDGTATNEEPPPDSSSSIIGSTGIIPSTSLKRKKHEEGYSAMLDRVSEFVNVCVVHLSYVDYSLITFGLAW